MAHQALSKGLRDAALAALSQAWLRIGSEIALTDEASPVIDWTDVEVAPSWVPDPSPLWRAASNLMATLEQESCDSALLGLDLHLVGCVAHVYLVQLTLASVIGRAALSPAVACLVCGG